MEAQAYLLILVALFGGATSEYTCKSLPAYLFPLGNKNCYKDPDIKSDVSSLLTRHGYKPEKLSTMTEDGYILNTFKVSKGGNGPPVLLVHGAGSNSGVFTALRKNSLAFTLIEGGYTVYLANLRGSRYSKEHKKLTASDQKYWDFSIDDLVDKEVPAILSFVIQDSKSKDGITYIGYDLGSTIFAGYASRNASLAQNQVKKAFLIGNAGKPSLLERILGKRSDLYFKKKKFLHLLRLFSDGKYRCFFAELFKKMGLTKIIFFWIVTRKYGPNGNLDGGILPAFYDTHFDSNPLKVEVQTWQTDKDGSFYRYYSIQGIKDLFGKHIKREPYDLTKIKVPTYTYISEDDKYSPKGQILHEYDQIPKEFRAGKKIITKKGFNNLAYFYGTDAKKLVYDDILQKIAGGGDSSSDESSNESGE